MQKLLTVIFDLIFPPTATAKILRTREPAAKLLQSDYYQNIQYLNTYTNPLIKSAILENKFNHHPQAARLLGELLEQWQQNQPVNQILFIPIPLSTKRSRERGHNQVVTILNKCPNTLHSTSKLLRRRLDTKPQTQLAKKERLTNLKNAFQYTDCDFDFTPYSQVILLDDVVTTGSTLRAAKNTLAPHLPDHIKLSCLAIAH